MFQSEFCQDQTNHRIYLCELPKILKDELSDYVESDSNNSGFMSLITIMTSFL